jgi:hypothetical protein
MIFLSLFSKMKSSIKWRVQHHGPGLYLYIIFPIAVSFLLTFIGARILNNLWPDFYIPWPVEAHVHHYAYGFFILAISGYLALVFSGPRAKYYIALLHGFGLGLAFDEYGLWLNLENNEIARWEYDGFLIIVGIILLIISAKPGWNFFKNHVPLQWWKRQNHQNNGLK